VLQSELGDDSEDEDYDPRKELKRRRLDTSKDSTNKARGAGYRMPSAASHTSRDSTNKAQGAGYRMPSAASHTSRDSTNKARGAGYRMPSAASQRTRKTRKAASTRVITLTTSRSVTAVSSLVVRVSTSASMGPFYCYQFAVKVSSSPSVKQASSLLVSMYYVYFVLFPTMYYCNMCVCHMFNTVGGPDGPITSVS